MTSSVRRLSLLILLTSTAYAIAAGAGTAVPSSKRLSPTQQTRLIEGYGKLPLSFEPNQGQADPQVKFLSRGDGYNLSLSSSEAVLSLQGTMTCSQPSRASAIERLINKSRPCVASYDSVLRISLLGGDPNALGTGEDELPGKSSYFMGSDSSKWHTNIANYRKVQYRDVYPGIDLVYYGNQRQLEHDFVVSPGADPGNIRLRFTGAKRMDVDRNGNLKLITADGVAELKRPVIYQNVAGVRREISGKYVKKDSNEIGFLLGNYNHKEKLVIDPVLVYSTYFDGNGLQPSGPSNIAVDSDKNMYLTSLSVGNTAGSTVISISKLSADGSKLLNSTFLTLSEGSVFPYGLAVDTKGNAYITGYTNSYDYPIVNALQPTRGGEYNCFITKINQNGSGLVYSTFLGGKESVCTGIAVDAFGSAFVTGSAAAGFPAVNNLFTKGTAFIAKLSPSGTALDFSTVFGGSKGEYGASIALDAAGEAIVVGATGSFDFPIKNALFPTCPPNPHIEGGGCYDSFVTKFNATGTALIYSTFLVQTDGGVGVAANPNGDAFIVGSAYENVPAVNAIYPKTSVTGITGFAMRLNPNGSALAYSTYLAGEVFAGASGIAVDSLDNAYITGIAPAGLSLVRPLEPVYIPKRKDYAAFLAKIPAGGLAYDYLTFIGPLSSPAGLAVDSIGDAYVAGITYSNRFPLVNPFQRKFSPGFISKISESTAKFSISENVDKTTVSPGGDLHYTITITNKGSAAGSGVVNVTSIRDRFRTCTVSNGDLCKFLLLGGRATVNLSPLGPGESRTILIYATAAKTAGDYNQIPNQATISSGPPLNETDSASTTVLVRETADISVTSSLIDNTNGLLHFVHTVTNTGPDNSHAVLLLDPLPAYTTFVSVTTTAGSCSFKPTIGAHGSVRCPLNNPDASAAVKVDVILQGTIQACRSVTNTVSITSQSIDSNSANDSSSVVAQMPDSVCGPPPNNKYLFSFVDQNFFGLNNSGDFIGNDPSTGYFILKNGATTPTPIPLNYVAGFNDLDDVLGNAVIDKQSYQGIYKDGKFQAVDFGPDVAYATLVALNNADAVLGYEQLDFSEDGLINRGGVVEQIGSRANGSFTEPSAFNNKGEATGSSSRNNQPHYAFLYTHGQLLNITPGYVDSYGGKIDSSGRVVGALRTSSSSPLHLFLYGGGKLQDLTPNSTLETYATSINDCGEIVGNAGAQTEGFVYAHGTFTPLNPLVSLPSGVFLQPFTINNRGQILGSAYYSATNSYRGFLMTPKVLEKCGSDAFIDNTADVANSSLGGNITYTITAKNLDTAASAFTVTDALDPTTSLVGCSVTGGAGTCNGTPGSQSVSINLPHLTKGTTATISITVAGSSVSPPQGVVLNTATLSSSQSSDYLSTAYTAVY